MHSAGGWCALFREYMIPPRNCSTTPRRDLPCTNNDFSRKRSSNNYLIWDVKETRHSRQPSLYYPVQLHFTNPETRNFSSQSLNKITKN